MLLFVRWLRRFVGHTLGPWTGGRRLLARLTPHNGAKIIGSSLGIYLGLCILGPGPTHAGSLADRFDRFPQWTSLPITQPVRGEDLIYPDWFEGTWQVTSTLLDQQAPLAPEVITPGFDRNKTALNETVTFPVRFVSQTPPPSRLERFLLLPTRPVSQVVADRVFNGFHIAQAYLGDQGVISVKVNPQNPNEQLTKLPENIQVLTVVTDRATETPSPDQFIATELSQQIFRGLPGPFLNRVETTTAYTHITTPSQSVSDPVPDSTPIDRSAHPPHISATQLTAIYLSPQDPDYFKAGDRPVALYQYHLDLTPLTDPPN
ncbi:MAG: DUF6816 family protein [Prochlorothrix sp.]